MTPIELTAEELRVIAEDRSVKAAYQGWVLVSLTDRGWKKWFPNIPPDRGEHHWQRDGKWVALTLAFSELGRRITGLPIDFQVQPQEYADRYYSTPTLARNPIGKVPLRSPPEEPPKKRRSAPGVVPSGREESLSVGQPCPTCQGSPRSGAGSSHLCLAGRGRCTARSVPCANFSRALPRSDEAPGFRRHTK